MSDWRKEIHVYEVPKGYGNSWKQIVASIAHNLGHVALAIHRLAGEREGSPSQKEEGKESRDLASGGTTGEAK